MADKKDKQEAKDGEELGKKLSEQADEAVEKGYAEDALTDQQKEALKAVEDNADAAKKFQESDDPEDYSAKRQQV